ncbi:hypothetical protein CTM67_16370 [Photobacterium phosphoreum]|nr:hypothetical protein CTM67_16370 [Photobacterium phosphoreum]
MTNEADKRDYKHLSGRSESSCYEFDGRRTNALNENRPRIICLRLRGKQITPGPFECSCCLALTDTEGEDSLLAEFH